MTCIELSLYFVDSPVKAAGNSDAPPPPPPPPPSGSNRRITNGTVATPLIKPFSTTLIKPAEGLPGASQGPSVPQMVPPPSLGTKPGLPVIGAPGSSTSLNNSKSPLQSAALGNLLSGGKNPHQIKNDLTAQLAAIKGTFEYTFLNV